MKRLIIYILTIILVTTCGQAQNKKQTKFLKVKILTMEPYHIQKGRLFKVQDSSVILSNKSTAKKGDMSAPDIHQIPVTNINTLKIMRRGNPRGARIGGGVGLAIGAILGVLSSKDDFFASWVAPVGLALIFAVPGIIIGNFVVQPKLNIDIKGRQEIYNKHIKEIQQYSRW